MITKEQARKWLDKRIEMARKWREEKNLVFGNGVIISECEAYCDDSIQLYVNTIDDFLLFAELVECDVRDFYTLTYGTKTSGYSFIYNEVQFFITGNEEEEEK